MGRVLEKFGDDDWPRARSYDAGADAPKGYTFIARSAAGSGSLPREITVRPLFAECEASRGRAIGETRVDASWGRPVLARSAGACPTSAPAAALRVDLRSETD
jgi:hypothetical protein